MPKIGFSTRELSAAVAELKEQCGEVDPRVVLCFASTKYEPGALSRELKTVFPKACVVGCSTAGEIVTGRMMSGSVVAMFLSAEEVEDAGCAVVKNLSAGAGVRDAFAELEAHFGQPVSAMDLKKHIGLVLIDGLSRAEEKVIEKIGDRTDLFFVGGSAGDDLLFRCTHVFADGWAYSDAALLVLLKVPRGFEIIKAQSFVGTGKKLVATQVDQANRKVIRFNGKPAAEAYAQALGVSVGTLAGQFMQHPLGLMVGGEPYVRSPQRVEEGAVVFYCQIAEGMELEVLTCTDIVADTRAALQAKLAEVGRVAGIIDFHCILRTLELRAEQRCHEYGAVFGDVPAVGFSTYGEAYIGHINQTSTLVLLR